MVPLRGNYKSFAAGEHHDYSFFIFHSSVFSLQYFPPSPEGADKRSKRGCLFRQPRGGVMALR